MLDDCGVVAGQRDEPAEATREVNLVLEAGDGLDQPLVVRRPDEHHVEVAADAHPFLGLLKTELGPRFQAVQLLLEVVEFVNGDIRAAEARRDRLQTFADVVDLDDVLDRQAGDKGAFSLDHANEAFTLEHEDRLANGRAADPELSRQRTLEKRLSHADFPIQDHRLKPLIGIRRRGRFLQEFGAHIRTLFRWYTTRQHRPRQHEDLVRPGRWDQPVTGCGFLDRRDGWRRVVKAKDGNAVGEKHVIDPAPGFLGELRNLVEHCMPTRMGDEERGMIGDIRLQKQTSTARRQHE